MHFMRIVIEVIELARAGAKVHRQLVALGAHGAQVELDTRARGPQIPFAVGEVPCLLSFDKCAKAAAVLRMERDPGIVGESRGQIHGGYRIVDDPVSTLDLPATFADFAGVSFSAAHSRSLKPMIQNHATRDFAYSEWDLRASRSGVDLDLRTVRTKRHKLTLDLRSGAGELYDLYDDPYEMNNRFNDPGFSAQQKNLVDMIRSRPADAVPRLPQVGMA